MRPIERKIEKEPNEEKKQALTEYAQAIRATLTFKRKSDWDQGGVRAVELCQNIHESLVEAAATYSHPLIEAMQDLTGRFKGELEN